MGSEPAGGSYRRYVRNGFREKPEFSGRRDELLPTGTMTIANESMNI